MSDPLTTHVQYVKGVGPYIASLLDKKGIHTVADLFYHFPAYYLDRRKLDTIRSLQPGKESCVIAEVVGSATRMLGRSRKRIFEIVVQDGTGIALLVFFNFSEKFLKKKYPQGKHIFISGECQMFGAQKQFVHPDIEDWEEGEETGGGILPVYPLTEGLYQKSLRKIIAGALEHYLEGFEESPYSVRAEGDSKVSLKEALLKVHSPPSDANICDLNEMKSVWHQRVIYDELFYLQLGLGIKKVNFKKEEGYQFQKSEKLLSGALSLLPFELTGAQKRVLSEIEIDLLKNEPMNRMLQGDVGCGKTMIAFLSSLIAIENQTQAVLMAPTEVLAQQHFINLKPLAEKLGIRIALLTRTTEGKNDVLDELAQGKIDLAIGTHALIQDNVLFKKLGLIIIDEQHRFGVMQRARLKKKSSVCPHILVMTATPIPRTLAMSVYGDLDVSIIDELPKGRIPIKTYVFNEKMRARAYDLIRRELEKGRQAYFVYPLIEESEKSDLKDAQSMALELSQVFSSYKVGLMHGRMKNDEKDGIMRSFKKNEIQILVSTTVIEVGVDVPNSTVMVVEHAERFGLSQLHQLRGRVGRGAHESYCLLMAHYAQSDETRFRLRVMEETTDGFKIAEEDLQLRGPGDFLGTRQSGLPAFRLAHLVRDSKLLAAARKRAMEIIEDDPDLNHLHHHLIKKILVERWAEKLELAEVS